MLLTGHPFVQLRIRWEATVTHLDSDLSETAELGSVASQILSSFLDDLAGIEATQEIAARLRAVIIDEGLTSEAAIRAAIFPVSE